MKKMFLENFVFRHELFLVGWADETLKCKSTDGKEN